MLEEIYKAINIAMTKFLEDTGKEELEDGDEFITVFNNCSLYIVKEDNNLQTRFIGGKPYEADLTLSAYEENEESHEN